MSISVASIDSSQSNPNNTVASQRGLACSDAAVQFQAQSRVGLSSHFGVALGYGDSVEMGEGQIDSHDSDVLSSTIDSLSNMTIDGNSDGIVDQMDEKSVDLMCEMRELEVKLREQREWAQKKASQAARKLSNDLIELKLLRMERDETIRVKKGKQGLEDTTMKKLSEMENALRKACGQVDHANAAIRQLETENAEIQAEVVASKLSASESIETCRKIAKKEKKCLTKLMALEKQKDKLQEEVIEEQKKITLLLEQLQIVQEAQKEAEIKWKQELNAKELVISQLEEQQRSKEAANAKTRQGALRHKIEVDYQRYKDDVQRLERELSRLKASAESTREIHPINPFGKIELNTSKTAKEANTKMLHDTHKTQEPSQKEVGHNRECLICMKDEVSVVFLPCAHQVLCARCNENHEKESQTNCPCCCIQIEERIRVYGATS